MDYLPGKGTYQKVIPLVSFEKLEKNHMKLQEKYKDLKSELVKSHRKISQKSQDLTRLGHTLESLQFQKESLERCLQGTRKQNRKLENTLTLGKTSKDILYISYIDKLTRENKEVTETNQRLEKELETLRDNKDLYAEILLLRQENKDCRDVIDDLNDKLNQSQTLIQELELIRHCNNEELNKLEAKILELKKNSNHQAEEMLKKHMEKALVDLQALTLENEQLKSTVKEAVDECSDAFMNRDNLITENKKLQNNVEELLRTNKMIQESSNIIKARSVRIEGENAKLKDENRELRTILSEN